MKQLNIIFTADSVNQDLNADCFKTVTSFNYLIKMANFIRESKYKNVLISAGSRETCYEQLRPVTSSTAESNMLSANSKFLAYIDAAGGGSALAVLPLTSVGKNHVPITSSAYQMPLIRAHSCPVTDFMFNPFNEHLLSSCAGDGIIKTWTVPVDGFVGDCKEPTLSISFNDASGLNANNLCGLVYHPCISSLLAVRAPREIGIFDIDTGSCVFSTATMSNTAFGADIMSMAWANSTRNLLSVTCKDKNMYLIDTRQPFSLTNMKCAGIHQGTRATRHAWCGRHENFVATTGHSKSNQDRELNVYDIRMFGSCSAFGSKEQCETTVLTPVSTTRLDTATGILLPFYDYDTDLLVLMGKGDINIKVFEMDADSTGKLHAVTNTVPTGCNSATDITRGATLLPKQCNDLMSCEILKVLRLYENSIQPISFKIARGEKTKFHDDLYPPTVTGALAVCTASEWQSVETSLPLNTVELKRPVTKTSVAAVAAAPISVNTSGCVNTMSTSPMGTGGGRPESKRFSMGVTSKFKHAYGTENPKSNIYFNIKPITTGIDGQVLACNDKYWGVPYQGGGGAVYISAHENYGKVEPGCAVLNGHKSTVLDLAFSPFHSDVLATASDDCTVKLWRLQEDDITTRSYTADDADVTISCFKAAVKSVLFHSVVPNLLTTVCADNTVKLFDVNSNEPASPLSSLTIPGLGDNHNVNNICNISYNYNGSLFVAACKDKTLHIRDPRVSGSGGTVAAINSLGRNLRAAWCSNKSNSVGTILTVSSSSNGMRQIQLFDPRKLNSTSSSYISNTGDAVGSDVALCTLSVDNAAGQLYPLYDEDTNLCYLVGKGDTIMRYYEINTETVGAVTTALVTKCNEFQTSKNPFSGVAMLPKRTCNVKNIEISRFLKLTTDSVIPLSFTVPRSDALKKYFQDDLFPPTRDYDINHFEHKTANGDWMTATTWVSDATAIDGCSDIEPATYSLKPDGWDLLSDRETIESNPNSPMNMNGNGSANSPFSAPGSGKNAAIYMSEHLKKEEDAKKKDQVFTRLQNMAIQRSKYHPNASGGGGGTGHGFKCDATPVHMTAMKEDVEVEEDEWD